MSGSSGLAVAVIGAGAAGLCAARHLAAATKGSVRPTILEQSRRVGGTWVYTQDTGTDENGLPRHSSMYQNLSTNLPKEVMAFPDFPFASQEKSFLHHTEVLQYLDQYAEAHDLHQYIQLGTQVESVCPEEGGWQVTTRELSSGQTQTATYQAVMVCNGHYSVPVMPSVPGLDLFTGSLVHSHNYRIPEDYQGSTVLVLGGGASGTDIAMELCREAKQVMLSHNNPQLSTWLPSNVSQVSGVSKCTGPTTFLLKDGTEVSASDVILATGYHYTFPFLTPQCGVTVENRVVGPLFKHLISTVNPSLAFVGLPVQVCPFPQFDLQVRYFLKTLLGEVSLPSREEMDRDTQEEACYRRDVLGMPDKYFHKMGTLQWEYNNSLARLGGLQPLHPRVEQLYMQVHHRRQANLPGYKRDIWSLDDTGGFTGHLHQDDDKEERGKTK